VIVLLSEIHKGSYVLVSNRYGSYVAKIVRETSTQFVSENQDRFHKKYGYKLGSRSGYYSRSRIDLYNAPTQSQIDDYERAVADKKRMGAIRDRIDSVKASCITKIAARLRVNEDRVKAVSQSNDGLVTITWDIRIEKLTEEELLAISEAAPKS